MLKKTMGCIIVLISLVWAGPLIAKGPGGGQNAQVPAVLSDAEIEHIMHLREEEKLARDVYLTLSDAYPSAAVFVNISEAEQRHMDALQRLIIKYGLDDPVGDDTVGAFSDPDFSDLFNDLVGQGMANYCEALQVGVAIEKLDIADIEAFTEVEAKDLDRVLDNLLQGSYYHLNAFTTQLGLEANHCE